MFLGQTVNEFHQFCFGQNVNEADVGTLPKVSDKCLAVREFVISFQSLNSFYETVI